MAEALGAADVNIDGFAEVEGLVHDLVEDSAAAAARQALAAAAVRGGSRRASLNGASPVSRWRSPAETAALRRLWRSCARLSS